jgi:histidinol dehydrogenase
MNINFWHLTVLTAAQREKLLRRAENDIDSVADQIAPIIADVRQRGDDALRDYAQRFDGATITGSLKASDDDFDRAWKSLDPAVIEAIRFCANNVRTHHQQQMDRVEKQWLDEVMPGVFAGEKITAIPSVGLYVPRGKGAFPSSMFMLCLPAVIAGVKTIAICTPPTPDGGIDAASLIAADICGVRNVYKAGGAQAIAALAFGTATIPKVVQVNGPGNAYVAAAKRHLSHLINPGMPAGPTDALVLADDSANAWNTALDLMNEAEHGPDSAAILVTTSRTLAEKVREFLPQILDDLPLERRDYCQTVFAGYGGIMLCDTLDQAIDFCNDYAAEHILVKMTNPAAIVDRLHHAGEILIGETTPMVLGNYGIGVNHVLPTGQQAHTHDCTSIWTFLKRTSLSYATREGYQRLKQPVATLAAYEGFAGHVDVLLRRHEEDMVDCLSPAALQKAQGRD